MISSCRTSSCDPHSWTVCAIHSSFINSLKENILYCLWDKSNHCLHVINRPLLFWGRIHLSIIWVSSEHCYLRQQCYYTFKFRELEFLVFFSSLRFVCLFFFIGLVSFRRKWPADGLAVGLTWPLTPNERMIARKLARSTVNWFNYQWYYHGNFVIPLFLSLFRSSSFSNFIFQNLFSHFFNYLHCKYFSNFFLYRADWFLLRSYYRFVFPFPQVNSSKSNLMSDFILLREELNYQRKQDWQLIVHLGSK